ncbi:MAG: PhoU family transcriptional regulator [Hadesarchaea archaeon]|nr:MAG: PhoU family transcriptional regulator [Hadesarchaea archaeon]TDA35112.1 MAG: PhoU family transcriptional regulator [Hadesarchaea archaeon]
MEKRKIQLTGGSTYILSLPKRWVVEMGIKEGDEVEMEKRDGSLVVFLSPKRKEKSEVVVKVSPDESPNALARRVISLYLVGCNVIRLKAKEGRISPAQREVLKNFVRTKLVGMEVITDLPGEMVLQVLMSYPELSVKDALKRMCLIAMSMREDVMEALESRNKELAKDVVVRDDEVDRFGMYIIRQLKSAVEDPRLIREIGLESGRECLGYRIVTKIVERVSDHLALVAQNLLQLKGEVPAEVVRRVREMEKIAFSVFEDAVNALFEGDYLKAEKVMEKREEILSAEERVIREVLKRVSGEDLLALRLIIESLRRIGEYGSDIAEIVLNLNAFKMVGER